MSNPLPAWPALDQIDTAHIDEYLQLVVDQLRQRWPEVDWRVGPVYTLVAYLHAVLSAQQAQVWDTLRRYHSLADTDEQLPEEWVDAIVRNYLIERLPQRFTTGTIQVVVRQNLPLVIAQGTVWLVGGQRFIVPRTISAALPDEMRPGGQDVPLEPTADGFWSFTLPLVAENPGTTSQLTAQLPAQPLQPPAGFVRATATGDFRLGRWLESNRQLLTRLRQGITAQIPASRAHWQSWLTQALPDVVPAAISVVGFGDAEQVRDRRSVLGISTGGKVDVYVRTSLPIVRSRQTVTATLIAHTSLGYGTYQFTLQRQQASGVYLVESVEPVGSHSVGSLPIEADLRQVDTSQPSMPDLRTPEEAAYSSYQTITIRFTDTSQMADHLAVGSSRSFVVCWQFLPDIDRLQEVVNQRQHRMLGGDCVIKAPVPCWVRVHLRIQRDPSDPLPATELIRAAVEQAIQQTGFTGALFAGQIHEAVLPYLQGQMKLSVLDLQGRLRYPDGTFRYVRDHDCLRVPEGEHPLVSARTVQFFPDSPSVQIDLVLQAL